MQEVLRRMLAEAMSFTGHGLFLAWPVRPAILKKTKKRFFILSFFQQFVILCLIHVDNTHN